jgi:asparagine synthase (glutamine-hydrolysing)
MKKEDQYYVFRHFIDELLVDYSKPIEDKKKAAFCSGGLDSSLVAAMYKVDDVYTAAFNDGEDETGWAKIVADHIGANHTIVTITENEYTKAMKELVEFNGEMVHPNEPCLYLVAKQIKADGYDEVLSGEGADDIFGGYTDLLENEDKYMESKEAFIERYAYVKRDLPDRIWEDIKNIGMRNFILKYHTPGLIKRLNNACGCAGIEAFTPLLRGNLAVMMAGVKDLDNKKFLRMIAKSYLPEEIINRPKVGFPIPMEKWFGSYKKFADINIKLWRSIKRD